MSKPYAGAEDLNESVVCKRRKERRVPFFELDLHVLSMRVTVGQSDTPATEAWIYSSYIKTLGLLNL